MIVADWAEVAEPSAPSRWRREVAPPPSIDRTQIDPPTHTEKGWHKDGVRRYTSSKIGTGESAVVAVWEGCASVRNARRPRWVGQVCPIQGVVRYHPGEGGKAFRRQFT